MIHPQTIFGKKYYQYFNNFLRLSAMALFHGELTSISNIRSWFQPFERSRILTDKDTTECVYILWSGDAYNIIYTS